MTIMQKKLLLLLLLLSVSCHEKESDIKIYSVNPKLIPFLRSFVEEAKKNNLDIKLENLNMEFDSSNSNREVCGHYIQHESGQREIKINLACWNKGLEQNREVLVYHELAHCFLNREHRDDLLPNNAPASIMISEGSSHYEPCIYPIEGDNSCNKTMRRDYYIAELFNPKTPVPDWAR